MKEHPILFKPEMIMAILDGKKSQTRRVIKPQPDEDGLSRDAGYPFIWYNTNDIPHKCPYGTPGHELWVKETINCVALNYKGGAYTQYAADGAPTPIDTWPWKRHVLSSIHMPRGAARLQLLVKKIRVEKLQDITEEDALAEGIDTESEVYHLSVNILDNLGVVPGASHDITKSSPEIHTFRLLWDSINAKPKPVKVKGTIHHYESFPWEDVQETREYRGKPWHVYGNPWLWVVNFEVIK